MSAPVPTLTAAGWVDSTAEKADMLFSYYFVADAAQTHIYPDDVVSLPAQVQAFGHDALNLKYKIRDDLNTYLSKYFDQVVIDVRTDLPNPDDPNRINVTLQCQVVDKGISYSLGRLISTVNSKITNIVDINNFKGE